MHSAVRGHGRGASHQSRGGDKQGIHGLYSATMRGEGFRKKGESRDSARSRCQFSVVSLQFRRRKTQDPGTHPVPGAPRARPYRCPKVQHIISPLYPRDRHIHGDAADVASTATTWSALRTAAWGAQACVEPIRIQKSYTHVHGQWKKPCPAPDWAGGTQ